MILVANRCEFAEIGYFGIDWCLKINASEFISTRLAFISYLCYSLVAFLLAVFANARAFKRKCAESGQQER